MKSLLCSLLSIVTTLFVSTAALAADQSGELDQTVSSQMPRTMLIKKDQNGNIYVHRSDGIIGKANESNASGLDKLQFERVSDVANLNVDSLKSPTEELDRDLPRQSWYYWGFAGLILSYPIYYYSYAYYPYYYYGWGGCRYYWYRW